MRSLQESIQDIKIEESFNEETYNSIIAQYEAKPAEMSDDEFFEGLFTGLLGGVAGATIGPSIMRAICKVLGINERGTLGGLLTSRMVLAAMGAELGYKM